jgi:hypothetical protein
MLCETVSVSLGYKGALGGSWQVVPQWKTWLQACHSVLCCTREVEFGKERQRKHQCRVVVGQVQIGSGEGLASKTSVHDPRGLFQHFSNLSTL